MDKQHFMHRLKDRSNQQKNHHSNQTVADGNSTDNLAEKIEGEKSTLDNLLKAIQKETLPFI